MFFGIKMFFIHEFMEIIAETDCWLIGFYISVLSQQNKNLVALCLSEISSTFLLLNEIQ